MKLSILQITLMCLLPLDILAQTYSASTLSATTFFEEGNMSKAHSQYGSLLSIDPYNLEYQFFYAVTCTADSALREEGVARLQALEGLHDFEPQRLFYLAVAYQHLGKFRQASRFFQRSINNAPKKANWIEEAQFRVSQCELAANSPAPSISINYSQTSPSDKDDFFRQIPISSSTMRLVLLPSELRSKIDKKKELISPIVFDPLAQTIFFSSYGTSDENGLDIYMSVILPDGSYGQPERLPNTINSEFDEINPVYHKASSSIIFASNRTNSCGGYDLYSSPVSSSSGPFLESEPLPRNWNSAANEYFLLPDEESLIDASSVISGGWILTDKTGQFGSLELHYAKAEHMEVTEDPILASKDEEFALNSSADEIATIDEGSNDDYDYVSSNNTDRTSNAKSTTDFNTSEESDNKVTKSSLAIQIGIFDNEPNEDLMPDDINFFSELLSNGLVKVYAGPFETEESRDVAKTKIFDAGMTHAFNVRVEPRVIEVQDPTPIMIQQGIYDSQTLRGTWYAIQLGAFSSDPDQELLEIARGTMYFEDLNSGVKRWYAAISKSAVSTVSALPDLLSRGAREDAFVVRLENGERIAIVNAKSVIDNSDEYLNVSDTPSSESDLYRVKIVSFEGNINAVNAASMLRIGTLFTIRSITLGNETIYYSSNISHSEAIKALDIAKKEGFEKAKLERVDVSFKTN